MTRCPEWNNLPLGEMLAEYGLDLKGWEEVSACLKVETAQGLFRLKCFAYPSEEFPFIYRLVQQLEERGFPHPERIRLTCRGLPGLTMAGRFYYLASWQEGATGFELTPGTLLQIGRLLGSFHAASRDFETSDPIHPARIQWGAWPGKLTARCRDLRRFIEMARQGRTAFDRLFQQHGNALLAAAEGALHKLEKLPYQEAVRRDQQSQYVCHRDCIPRNVVERPDGEFVLIDYDNAACAERIDDLAKLLRTFSSWQLDMAGQLLQGYGQVLPLEAEEIRLIGAFLQFPMEYWQLGKLSYQRGRPHLRTLQKRLTASQAKAQFLLNLERNPERVMSRYAVFPRNPG
ncbi:MAG: phosphotransferase [Firmicutes bacterium]|jgi:CotS family spore coat protein|nr:phosphotransferase [Bacillota bacterium]